MTMPDYFMRAAVAWFAGFFPLAEIYVAVPLGLASGLDPVSAVFWSVLGNYTPVLLIHYGYDQLLRVAWLQAWLARLTSASLQESLNRWGYWFVLVITPWAGVWATAVTAKVFKMRATLLLLATLKSIVIYGVATAVLVEGGMSLFE